MLTRTGILTSRAAFARSLVLPIRNPMTCRWDRSRRFQAREAEYGFYDCITKFHGIVNKFSSGTTTQSIVQSFSSTCYRSRETYKTRKHAISNGRRIRSGDRSPPFTDDASSKYYLWLTSSRSCCQTCATA